jgi:DcmR-like sensory protein
MSPHRERVVRGSVASEHLVHVFDGPQSLVETVATYLFEGWRRHDALLVVIRPSNWAPTSAELVARAFPVGGLIDRGRLVVLDAATTLATFLVNGEPDPEKFDSNVGSVIRRLCNVDSQAGLTVYGEMVDILAEQGNFIAAEHLEDLWNNLSAQCSFRLLCGYSSAHFGDQRSIRHRQSINGLHTDASAPADAPAPWLLTERRSRPRAGAF